MANRPTITKIFVTTLSLAACLTAFSAPAHGQATITVGTWTVSQSANLLSVSGTTGVDTLVTGRNSAGRLTLTSGSSTFVAASTVTSLVIKSYGGFDSIDVQNPSLVKVDNVLIDGGNGNDTIKFVERVLNVPFTKVGILGGYGHDNLSLTGGNPTVSAGPGSDRVAVRGLKNVNGVINLGGGADYLSLGNLLGIEGSVRIASGIDTDSDTADVYINTTVYRTSGWVGAAGDSELSINGIPTTTWVGFSLTYLWPTT